MVTDAGLAADHRLGTITDFELLCDYFVIPFLLKSPNLSHQRQEVDAKSTSKQNFGFCHFTGCCHKTFQGGVKNPTRPVPAESWGIHVAASGVLLSPPPQHSFPQAALALLSLSQVHGCPQD